MGEFAPLSPDYVRLTPADLSDDHRFLQGRSKAGAFSQWQALVAAHGRTKGSLLDIGCGIGSFLDFAAEAGFEVYGYDVSGAQAADARERHPKVRAADSIASYESCLGSALPVFDVITLWDVFEHVREPQALLADIRSRLGSAGLLFLSVPGGGIIPAKLAFSRLRGRPPGLTPWEHVFYYEPFSLQHVLGSAGFSVVASGGVVPYRRSGGLAELVRRGFHRGLAHTRYAFQIFALATPSP